MTGDCVVMSVGAAGALNSLLKAILNEGDTVTMDVRDGELICI